MSSPEAFDVLIIGSGQAGGPLAGAFGKAGRRTALVERLHVGGSCVNVGCTPTKTMVASARVAYLARRGADYGVNAGTPSVNLAGVKERKDAVVHMFRSGSERGITGTPNVTLVRGEASFAGPKTIDVTGADGAARTLTAPLVVVNTGCRPAVPDVPGLAGVPFLNSTTVMDLTEVPDHLLVLGGGYIGLEFGQMFRRFGSQVTVVQSRGQLLANEDADVAEEVAKILREDGVEVLLNARAKAAAGGPGDVRLTVQTAGGERTLAGSHLLVAAGRVPNTDALAPQRGGVAVDARGFIPVNDKLETNVPGVYALGDVNGGPQFTHVSYDDYRVLKENVLLGGGRVTTGRLVPYTVFIDPQLGRVGLTEAQAKQRGLNVRVAKMPMSYVARALEMDEPRGLMKAVVDADSKQILGCAVLGVEGGEVMSVVQMAMLGKLPYTALRDGIFAHPTLAEALNNLFAGLDK